MENTGLVTAHEVEEAALRIAPTVRLTPLVATDLGPGGAILHLKAECLQVGGSFKIRGATNAVLQLSSEDRDRGVITHSSGNHGQALARAAKAAGVTAVIVMPHQSPVVKQEATRALGARVVLVDIADRAAAVARIRSETGAVFVPPYDDRRIVAGQGTVGREIVADLPDVATVLVPVSGGGLVSGVAVAVKAHRPDVRVVAVEPKLAGDLAEGFTRGERVVWDTALTGRTIADGLRVGGVGEVNWAHIRALVDDAVTVTEDEIIEAMRAVLLRAHLVCEPSGAVAVAGLSQLADVLGAGPAVAVVSGGNVDPALLAEVVTR